MKDTITPTRYPELGIAQHGPGLWRIISDGDYYKGATGPHYATKGEAFADLDRFASLYGATGAEPYSPESARLLARVAELEADNKALRDALERIRGYESNYQDTASGIEARAALAAWEGGAK